MASSEPQTSTHRWFYDGLREPELTGSGAEGSRSALAIESKMNFQCPSDFRAAASLRSAGFAQREEFFVMRRGFGIAQSLAHHCAGVD